MVHRFQITLAIVLAASLCANADHAQAQIPADIVLRSGERLPGRLIDLNESIVTTQSDLLLDPIELIRSQVARIDFNRPISPEADDAPLGFRFRSGTELYGWLLSLGEAELHLATARLGAIRVPRSEIVEIYHRAGSSCLLTASLANWQLAGAPAAEVAQADWQFDANGRLRTSLRDAIAFLPHAISSQGTLDITVSAADVPTLTVALHKDRDAGPSFYCANGSLMLIGSDGVEFAELPDPKSHTISLRIGWDYASNKIWVSDEQDVLLVQTTAVQPTGETGISVLNQGKDLNIARLRLSMSSSAPFSTKAEEAPKRRADVLWLTNGQRKSGTLLSHSDDRWTFQETGYNSPTSLSPDELHRIVLATGERSSAPPRSLGTLIWNSGEQLHFASAKLEGSNLVAMVPEIEQALPIPVDTVEAMLIGAIVRNSTDRANLRIGPLDFPGRCEWGDPTCPLRWQLQGQTRPARINLARKVVITREVSTPSNSPSPAGTDRIFLSGGDVFPGHVTAMTDTNVTLSTRFSQQVILPREAVQAIEFHGTSNSAALAFTKESRQQLLTLPRFSKDRPFTHALLGKNGDLLRGFLVSLDDKSIEFDSRSEPLLIPRDHLAAVVCFQPTEQDDKVEPARTTPYNSIAGSDQSMPDETPLLQLRLHGGYALSGRFVAKRNDHVELESTTLGRCKVPQSMIESVRANDPHVADDVARYREWSITSAIEPRWDRATQVPADAAALEGSTPDDFELPLLDGQTFRLSDHRGKVVVIDFWATWCVPCVRATPELLKALRDFSPEQVVLFGLDQGETASQVREFLAEHEWIDFQVALDSAGDAAKQFSVTGMPHLVVIDPHGVVRHTQVGYSPDSADKVRGIIEKLLSGRQ